MERSSIPVRFFSSVVVASPLLFLTFFLVPGFLAPGVAEAKPKAWPSRWAEDQLFRSPTSVHSWQPRDTPPWNIPPWDDHRRTNDIKQVISLVYSLDRAAQEFRYSLTGPRWYHSPEHLLRAADRFAEASGNLVEEIRNWRFNRRSFTKQVNRLSDRAREIDRRIDRERYLSPHIRRAWRDTRYFLSSLVIFLSSRGSRDCHNSHPPSLGYPWGSHLSRPYPP